MGLFRWDLSFFTKILLTNALKKKKNLIPTNYSNKGSEGLYEKHLNSHAWFRGGINRPKTFREKINRFLFTTHRCFMIISVYVT